MSRLNLNMYDIVAEDEPDFAEQTSTLTEESPAISLFESPTDGKHMFIGSDLSALDAVKLLSNTNAKVHFVVNSFNHFQGIIELENLNTIEFIKRTSNGYSREELLVSDFMIPRKTLRAFDLEELKKAKVRDVIDSLGVTGAQYCLAVDRVNHRICGLLAREDIESRMQIKIGRVKPSILQMVSSLKG